MGQYLNCILDTTLIAAGGIVQGQCDGLCVALRGPSETGNCAVRHRNCVQDAVIATLKVRPQHGVNIAVETVICAGLDVRIVPAVRYNLPNEHLRGGVLHLTAVAIVHLRVAERQNLLDVAALEVIQLQLPVGGVAGFLGGVGGVVLLTQGRGVRFDTIRIYTVDGVVCNFAGVEVMTVAVRTIHLITVAFPPGRLVGGKGYTGGLAHGTAATQQHKPIVVHAGQRFAVHGSGHFSCIVCL